MILQTSCGFRCDSPRNLQSEGSQGAEQGAKATLVFSCCERFSRALCSLPVLSVKKQAKKKSEVLGCNSQTNFKRVMLYCIFPFSYKECLAFMSVAVPEIHLVQNHALLHKERSSLKSAQSQREVMKMVLFVPRQICPWMERWICVINVVRSGFFFFFIEVLTLHLEPWQCSHNVAFQQKVKGTCKCWRPTCE